MSGNATLRNAKHEHFAQLVSNGESATRAYVLAGYSEGGAKQSAARLLTNADVCERIAYLRQQKEAKHEKAVSKAVESAAIDKAWVLSKLVKVTEMGMQAEPVYDEEGNPAGEYKQNLAAANKALELIGKEMGMFVDRKEVRTGPLDTLPHDDLKRLRDALGPLVSGGHVAGNAGSTQH